MQCLVILEACGRLAKECFLVLWLLSFIYPGAGWSRFPGYVFTILSVKLRNIKRKKGELNLPLIYLMVVGGCGLGFYMLYLFKRLPQMPCVFKVVMGHPCPTCGSTRVILNLFDLDINSAFCCNPLFFLGGITFIAWILYGFYMFFSGKKIAVTLSKNESLFMKLGLAILFILNWVYLIAMGV